MTVTIRPFLGLSKAIALAQLNLGTDEIGCVLLKTTYGFINTAVYLSDLDLATHEVTATGYIKMTTDLATGGLALPTRTVANDVSPLVTEVRNATIASANLTVDVNNGIRRLVYFQRKRGATLLALNTMYVLCCVDLGEDISPAGWPLYQIYDVHGWFNMILQDTGDLLPLAIASSDVHVESVTSNAISVWVSNLSTYLDPDNLTAEHRAMIAIDSAAAIAADDILLTDIDGAPGLLLNESTSPSIFPLVSGDHYVFVWLVSQASGYGLYDPAGVMFSVINHPPSFTIVPALAVGEPQQTSATAELNFTDVDGDIVTVKRLILAHGTTVTETLWTNNFVNVTGTLVTVELKKQDSITGLTLGTQYDLYYRLEDVAHTGVQAMTSSIVTFTTLVTSPPVWGGSGNAIALSATTYQGFTIGMNVAATDPEGGLVLYEPNYKESTDGTWTPRTTYHPLLRTAITTANAIDAATAAALANDLKQIYEVHRVSIREHSIADNTNMITAGNASSADTNSITALANDEKAKINAHRTQASVHLANDTTNVILSADATDLTSAYTLLNEIKADCNLHFGFPYTISGLSLAYGTWQVKVVAKDPDSGVADSETDTFSVYDLTCTQSAPTLVVAETSAGANDGTMTVNGTAGTNGRTATKLKVSVTNSSATSATDASAQYFEFTSESITTGAGFTKAVTGIDWTAGTYKVWLTLGSVEDSYQSWSSAQTVTIVTPSATITGFDNTTPAPAETITIQYAFAGGTESGTTFQWYSGTAQDGSDKASLGSSNGAQTATYTIQAADANKYLFCVVTPKNTQGVTGSPATSSASVVCAPLPVETLDAQFTGGAEVGAYGIGRFGNANNYQSSQSFLCGKTGNVTRVDLALYRGAGTDDQPVYVEIWSDAADNPNALITNGQVQKASFTTGATPFAVSSISRSSNVTTVVTTAPHGMVTTQMAKILNVVDATYNGSFGVTVINSTTFTYANTGTNGSSSGGNVRPWLILTYPTGAAVTSGQQYWLTGRFVNNPGSLTSYYLGDAAGGNPYANGRCANKDGAAAWTTATTNDTNFRVWVTG